MLLLALLSPSAGPVHVGLTGGNDGQLMHQARHVTDRALQLGAAVAAHEAVRRRFAHLAVAHRAPPCVMRWTINARACSSLNPSAMRTFTAPRRFSAHSLIASIMASGSGCCSSSLTLSPSVVRAGTLG